MPSLESPQGNLASHRIRVELLAQLSHIAAADQHPTTEGAATKDEA
jgi:hypothetical protein